MFDKMRPIILLTVKALTHTPTQPQQGPILWWMLNYYLSLHLCICLQTVLLRRWHLVFIKQLRRRDIFISYGSPIHRAVGILSPNVSCYNVMFLPSAPTRRHLAGLDVFKVDLGCCGNRVSLFITLDWNLIRLQRTQIYFSVCFYYYVYSRYPIYDFA